MPRPSDRVFSWVSTAQVLLQHCPHCDVLDEFPEFNRYDFQVPSIITHLEEIEIDWDDPDLTHEEKVELLKKRQAEYILGSSLPIVHNFEAESQKLISALVEGDYIITRPQDGDGYYGGRVLWTHPLAKKYFDEVIDIDYYDGSQSESI